MFSQSKIIKDVELPKGKFLPCAIEQFSAKEFFNNECGWTRNDIAVLAATTSKAQYDAIVQRLVENKATYNLKPDTKLSDAYEMVTPKWCQSPLEVQEFAERAANLLMADVDKMYKNTEDVKEVVNEPSEGAAKTE